MKLEVTYRTFLYLAKYKTPALHVGAYQKGMRMVDGKPKLAYKCEFVRWLDDWQTESVEVSYD